MAKRRVSSQTPMESDLLDNLSALGEDGVYDQLSGLGGEYEVPQPENVNIPKVPSNPELYDQPKPQESGFPEGLEFLQDIFQGKMIDQQAPEQVPEQIEQPLEQPIQDESVPVQEPVPEPTQEIADVTSEDVQEPPQEDMGFLERFGNEFVELGNLFSGWADPKEIERVSSDQARIRENELMRQEAQSQGVPLEGFKASREPRIQRDQEEWTQEMSDALQNPYTRSVYGATDVVFNSPSMTKEIEKIGIPNTPEMEEAISTMEASISEQSEEQLKAQGVWSEQNAEIRERIDQNRATDSDKLLIGLALMMPLIAGGFFGAEVGVASLGGAAEGLMNAYKDRQTRIREDEDRVTNINKLISESKQKQGDLELKRLAIPETVKKSFGEHPYEHLKNMDLVTFSDEEGNQSQGVRIKPGLVADISYLSDKDAKKDVMSEAKEVNENRTAVNNLGDNARKIIEISQQIKDDAFYDKVFQAWKLGKAPSLVAGLGEDVILDGRKVNSAVALTQLLEDTLEKRRLVMNVKNFGPQLFEHFERLLTNPYGKFTSAQDLIDQTLRLYSDTRNQFMGDAERRGFVKEALLDDFYEKDKIMYEKLNKQESSKKEVGDKRRRMMEDMEISDA